MTRVMMELGLGWARIEAPKGKRVIAGQSHYYEQGERL